MQDVVEGARDLLSQTFLNLEPSGEHLDDPGQLAQANDPSVWDVCDVRLSKERQHVMLAQTVELDVANHHHVRGAFAVEQTRSDDVSDVHFIAARQPGE